jgi:PBP1b-binding outer membrane lipoprotein LpoB
MSRRSPILAMAFLLAACSVLQHGDGPIPPENEVALPPKSTVFAETANGPITIKAGSGRNRCYTWDVATRCIEMAAQKPVAREPRPLLSCPG